MQKESLSMTSAPNRAYHQGKTGIWVPLNLRDQDCQESSLTAGGSWGIWRSRVRRFWPCRPQRAARRISEACGVSVLEALRDLFSHHPETTVAGPEMLAELLYEYRLLSIRPENCEVEAALEALRVEGEVLA